jgi:Ca-activated chloride channel homolog
MTPWRGLSCILSSFFMRVMVLLAVLIGCGIARVHAQPAVSLETATDHKFYRENSDSEVYLEARIVPARSPGVGASPRNVVFVIDRSGSMAGEPIAALRKATTAAIGALAPGDFVSVVVFGSEVETLIEAQRRDQLGEFAERLNGIEPAGGAALYDAINQAAAQVRRNSAAGTINQILLVTDGPPTKGPREIEDFSRLAGVFAGEGIMVSTLGLGPDFNEDMLAAMARAGQGQFRYVPQLSGLEAALVAELPRPGTVIGYDAELTIEFNRAVRKGRSHTWRAPNLDGGVFTWRLPRLVSDQPLSLLVSAEIGSFHARFELPAFATVKLRWKKPDSGEAQETTRIVPVTFSRDNRDVRDSLNVGVARAAAADVVREGLQRAIEELDRGDPRRALRVLRTTRGETREINFDLDDVPIAEIGRRVDAFLTEAQARVLGPADRKILRSGLSGGFEPPAVIVEPKN